LGKLLQSEEVCGGWEVSEVWQFAGSSERRGIGFRYQRPTKGRQVWTCQNQAHRSIIADVKKAFFLTVLVCPFLIAESAGAAFVLLKDEFDGESIDSSKWSVATPFSNSSVVQAEGKLTLNNNGQVTALISPTAPYSIVLSNVVMSSFEVLSITVRSDGVIPQGQEVAPGIRFHLWNQNGYSGAFYYPAAIEGGQNLQDHGYFSKTQSYTIRIDDDGERFALYVNDSQILSSLSTLSSGNKITIFNRGTQTGWGIPSSTSIGSIQITQEIPPDSDNDGVNDYREDKDGTDLNDATSFNPLSKGLVVHYPFQGSLANTASPSYNGAGSGALSFDTDRFGNNSSSLKFSWSSFMAPSDYLDISPTPFDVNGNYTVALWVFGTPGSANPVQQILSTANDTSGGLILRYHADGVYGFASGWYGGDQDPPPAIGVVGDTSLESQWNHLLLTRHGSATDLYLNGKRLGGLNPTPNAVDGGFLRIGWYAYNLDGSIDDLRIYGRSFSPEEVHGLYFYEAFNRGQRSFLTTTPSIMGHYSAADFNANRTNGRMDVTTNPSAFNLFTQSEYESFGALRFSNGISSVTTNPAVFNLFTQEQFNSNRTAGQSDVISNPAGYNLYTSESIMDLRMEGLMIPKTGGVASVTFQPQTTTNLATKPFTNNGAPITFDIPMSANHSFMRVEAKPFSTPVPPQP